jgi:hypothetical protein
MEEFVTFTALVAIATHVTSLVKYLSAGQVREFVTGLVPVVGLFLVLLLGAEADATAGIVVPGLSAPLGALDVASLLLVSLAGGSGGATLFNFRRAVDNHDSAVEPPLGGARSAAVPAQPTVVAERRV